MVVNFQSWLDPFIIITALPGALVGIVWMLFATGTTFSVPSLMGAIMAIGVATANSILVVTFANGQRREGMDAFTAAVEAGRTRMRPVLMTALAMVVGMLPMSLGLGEGGEQNAPLGRAVIGGLVVATAATLLFVPLVYSVLRRHAARAAGRSRGVVPMEKRILALDQGTTSSRAMVFGRDGRPVAVAQEEFAQILPASGVVEHDPEVLWASQLRVAREALAHSSLDAAQIAAIGIANQRETTILWDRDTGRPVANAIVWQSRVSAPRCDRLKAEGLGPLFSAKTGLMINAYFSGTKISHLLDACNGLRSRAERGEILFGTVDTWLVWRLTGGRRHMTDYTNASRTLIFNIHTLDWDDELLEILDIPRAMLPEVRPSSEVYGETSAEWFGRAIPIAGNAGDQQAAAFGQACFQPAAPRTPTGPAVSCS